MNDYIIATASTADLPLAFLQENDVPFIKYTFCANGELLEDDCLEATRQKAYEDMRAGSVYTTSMINTFTYYTFFKSLMEGGKDVIFLDMTKKVSSSYAAACAAAEKINEEFPAQRFYMADTLCISGGLALLVKEMLKRREEGLSFDEAIAWHEENKLKFVHRFTVDDLQYLKRGGRVSNGAAMVGAMLAVKPVLYIPDSGELVVAAKTRGRKHALDEVLAGMQRDLDPGYMGEVNLLHADCLDDAQYLAAKINEAFPAVASVNIGSLGVVIGSHCGPGLIAVFYFGGARLP